MVEYGKLCTYKLVAVLNSAPEYVSDAPVLASCRVLSSTGELPSFSCLVMVTGQTSECLLVVIFSPATPEEKLKKEFQNLSGGSAESWRNKAASIGWGKQSDSERQAVTHTRH